MPGMRVQVTAPTKDERNAWGKKASVEDLLREAEAERDALRADEKIRSSDLRAERDALKAALDVAEAERDRWKEEALRKYPTPEAYDAACAAMHKAKAERDALRAERDTLKAALKWSYDAMCTWFSSEYIDHPETQKVRAALKGRP